MYHIFYITVSWRARCSTSSRSTTGKPPPPCKSGPAKLNVIHTVKELNNQHNIRAKRVLSCLLGYDLARIGDVKLAALIIRVEKASAGKALQR